MLRMVTSTMSHCTCCSCSRSKGEVTVMSNRSVLWYASSWIVCIVLAVQAFAASGYRILKRIPIASTGENTWDYISIDEVGRRLFVTHETQVEVLSADTGKPLGRIPANGAH